jgi:integrase
MQRKSTPAKRRKGANGQGGITVLPDGRVQARISVRLPGQTKPTRLVAYGKSEPEAWQALDELRAKRVRGEIVAPDRLTVAQLLDEFVTLKEANGLRSATLYSYRRHVAHYLSPYLGAVRVQALTTAAIQAHYTHLLQKGKTKISAGRVGRAGLAPKSIRHIHNVLHGALELARRNKVILANPAQDVQVPRPKGDRPVRVVLSPAQLGSLAQAAVDDPEMGAFWLLLVESGARQSELLGLQWGDVDWSQHTVRIERSLTRHNRRLDETKTPSGRRELGVSAETLLALRAHRVRQEADREAAGVDYRHDLDLIFCKPTGEPLGARTVYGRFKTLLRRLDLPPGAHLHGVRHSVATGLFTEGGMDMVSVSKLLGHSSPAVTMSIYANPDRRHQDAASQRLRELLRRHRPAASSG